MIVYFFSVIFLCTQAFKAYSQDSTSAPAIPKLVFEQGKKYGITMDVKTKVTQQAMGRPVDFDVNATGVHHYAVTNATEDNTTLHHEVDQIIFSFDGMGQKRSFNSDSEKDMKGMFGSTIKQYKEKKYDMIIDPTGQVMMSFPEKVDIKEEDSRLAIVTNMLKDVLDIVQPPKKGTASFFKILPAKEIVVGDTWNERTSTSGNVTLTTYTISEISDTAIIVDYEGNSSVSTEAEMMGNKVTTNMKNTFTGKITLDPLTRIMREKTMTMDGKGEAETPFGKQPVTSKVNTVIKLSLPQE